MSDPFVYDDRGELIDAAADELERARGEEMTAAAVDDLMACVDDAIDEQLGTTREPATVQENLREAIRQGILEHLSTNGECCYPWHVSRCEFDVDGKCGGCGEPRDRHLSVLVCRPSSERRS